MEKIALTPIDRSQAAAALRAAGLIDPAGQFTPESLAASGQGFELATDAGKAVFVAQVRGDHLWIHGAGTSAGAMMGHGLAFADQLAKSSGCRFVAFETARPGLVRIAKKHGYKNTALVMKKAVS